MIYEFYSNRTSAPIVNYLCEFIPFTKLVDYEENGDLSSNNTIYEGKLFTLGSEGQIFKLLITKDDNLIFSINNSYRGKLGKFSDIDVERMKSYLMQVMRDHKLNTIGI